MPAELLVLTPVTCVALALGTLWFLHGLPEFGTTYQPLSAGFFSCAGLPSGLRVGTKWFTSGREVSASPAGDTCQSRMRRRGRQRWAR
jgi:hypothetical protein